MWSSGKRKDLETDGLLFFTVTDFRQDFKVMTLVILFEEASKNHTSIYLI